MALVSVIIPCYNSEKYISKCLLALEDQTFRDFDVILVDDCSNDNTVAVIELFRQKSNLSIKCVRNELNSGPAKSRNKGIALSESQYIAFCDSDDWYENDYLQLMVAAAKDNDADIVFCNSQKVLLNGNAINIDLMGNMAEHLSVHEALILGIDSLCLLMIKRAIITEVDQPDIRNGEDMAIIPLLIMRSQKFASVKKPIYNYLCRPGSLSLNSSEASVKSLESSFAYVRNNQMPGFADEVEYIGVKNIVYGALLNHFKYSNNKKTAEEILYKFELNFPEWIRNKYLSNLAIYKRIFVFLAKIRCFTSIKIMCRIHAWITERG